MVAPSQGLRHGTLPPGRCTFEKPNDPTNAAKFNTCRFADHKEKVIDLLRRVTTVCVGVPAYGPGWISLRR